MGKYIWDLSTIDKAIEASEILLDYYRSTDRDYLTMCPFCVYFYTPDRKCMECPWVQFEKMPCYAWCIKEGYTRNIVLLRSYRHPHFTKARIPMLKNWLKRLRIIRAALMRKEEKHRE